MYYVKHRDCIFKTKVFLIDVFHCMMHNENNCNTMRSTMYTIFKSVQYLCVNTMSYLKPLFKTI